MAKTRFSHGLDKEAFMRVMDSLGKYEKHMSDNPRPSREQDEEDMVAYGELADAILANIGPFVEDE